MKNNDYVSHKVSWNRRPWPLGRGCSAVITTLQWWFCTHHIIKQQSVCPSWSLMMSVLYWCVTAAAAGAIVVGVIRGKLSVKCELYASPLPETVVGLPQPQFAFVLNLLLCVYDPLHRDGCEAHHQQWKCALRIFTTTLAVRFSSKDNSPSNKRHFRHQ